MKQAIRWILTIFGLLYIGWAVLNSATSETIFQQMTYGLGMMTGWLFLIWIAIITQDVGE